MKQLLFVLLIKAFVLGLIIIKADIGLAPDEAQYWTWSQEIDWGYYSKPPGIAWQIWLTTALFKNQEFGVRFGALVIGFLLSVAVFWTARAAELSQRVAFWAAVIAAFSPLGIYLSFAATTDGGAILFMTLGTAVVIKGINKEEGPNYLLAGLCILAGALFKWTAFVFWLIVIPYLIFFKAMRKKSLLLGIAVSLLALLPSLYWNITHEWATFRHVGSLVGQKNGGNFLDFFAAQFGLLAGVFFVLLFLSLFYLRRKTPKGLFFAAGFVFAILFYLCLSFFKKMQPNWAAYLYPPALILVAWLCCEHLKKGRLWLQIGSGFSVLTVSILFLIPWLQSSTKWPLSYVLNPFRQSVGGQKITELLTDAGYRPGQDFLFADKYQTASLLSFYGPEQKRAYYFNISETRKTQFSYWPQMQQNEVGKTGYFVVVENTNSTNLNWYIGHYQSRLSPYFEKIEYMGAYPLFSVADKPVKYALIFASHNYSGNFPSDLKKY